MAHVVANAVEDTTATTLTGSYTVDGVPPTGAQSFDTVLADGDTCVYQIDDLDIAGSDVEVGLGTWTEIGGILTRTTIFYSTNGGSAVSWGSGTKKLRMVFAADRHCDSEAGIGIGTLTDNTLPFYDAAAGQVIDSSVTDDGSIVRVSSDLRVDTNTVVGDTTQNPKTVASWTSGGDHAYLNLYEGTNDAYIVCQGQGGAYLAMVDLGGGVNDKFGMWCVESGRMDLHSYNDNGTARTQNIISCDMGTGGVGIGVVNSGTSALYVSGGRIQLANDEDFMVLNSTSGVGGTWTCDTSNDVHLTVGTGGTKMITFDETNTELEFGQNAHFGTNTKVISANAVTLDLGESNHFELDLAAATADPTITYTEPVGQSAGCVLMKQDTTVRSPSFATTGSAVIKWPEGEPIWASDTASYYRLISWSYCPDADFLILIASAEFN